MKMKTVLLAVAVLALVSADVFAGGGGSKADPTIEIRNNAGTHIAVMGDATAWLADGADPNTFLAYGGKILNPKQKHTFKVKAGTVTVFAVLLDANGDPIIGSEHTEQIQVAAKAKIKRQVVQADGWAWIQPL